MSMRTNLLGEFVVSREGIVLSACALGLGNRHIAAPSMSAVTKEVVLWFLKVQWYDYSVMDNWSAKSFPSFG